MRERRIFLYDQDMFRLKRHRDLIKIFPTDGESHLHAAARRIMTFKPDLIIADWFESEGPELIKLVNLQTEGDRLRKIDAGIVPRNQNRPVVLMSDFNQTNTVCGLEMIERFAKQRGAVAYIARPVTNLEEFVINVLRDIEPQDPIEAVISYIGGAEVFDQILRRHGIRTQTPTWHTLRAMLSELGQVAPDERLKFILDEFDSVRRNSGLLCYRAYSDVLQIYIGGAYAGQHLGL